MAAELHPKQDRGADPVRIGIAVAGSSLAGWQRQVVERIAAEPQLEIALVIVAAPRGGGFAAAGWRFIDGFEGALARRVLGRLLRGKGIPAEALDTRAVPVAELPALKNVHILEAPTEASALRAHNLDVIVALDPVAITEHTSAAARHGVWSMSTANGPAGGSIPLGFWEVYRNEPVADVRIVAAASPERVIASGGYGTFRWSWSLNSVLLARRAAWLLVDALRRLPPREGAPVSNAHSWRAAGSTPNTPGTVRGLVALTLCYWRVLSEALRRSLSDERWRLLLVEATRDGRPARPPRVIEPPPHAYWADPFVVRRDGTSFIFFEEYLYAEARGVISYIAIADSELREPVLRPTSHRVLDDGHHLSYPFLFRHAGELYMIPESSAVGRVDLWRCSEFPGEWRRERTLIADVSAADTSLLNWNGRWWLFTNIDRSAAADHRSELHVFFSDDPIQGQWTPHPLNPVVVDARSARMAGGFLATEEGQPVRCCQVQGRRYGEEIAYRLVEELSETRYVERPIDWPGGMVSDPGARHHHVALGDGMIVADECQETSKLRRIFKARTRQTGERIL